MTDTDDHFHEDDDDDDSDPDYRDNKNKGDDSSHKIVYTDEEDAYFNRIIETKFETQYRACDKKSNLYLLQQERFLKGKPPPSKGQSAVSR